MSESCVDISSSPSRSLPVVVEFLLSNHVHYTTLTICTLGLVGRYLRSLLPGPHLMLLERTLEEVEEILLAAQENRPFFDTQFVFEVQLQLNKLRLEISDLRLENFSTSVWRELWAFCKGHSFWIQECRKRATELQIRIRAQIEREHQHIIKVEIDKLESMISQGSDVIAKPLPCVLPTNPALRGRSLSVLPVLPANFGALHNN